MGNLPSDGGQVLLGPISRSMGLYFARGSLTETSLSLQLREHCVFIISLCSESKTERIQHNVLTYNNILPRKSLLPVRQKVVAGLKISRALCLWLERCTALDW